MTNQRWPVASPPGIFDRLRAANYADYAPLVPTRTVDEHGGDYSHY